MVVVEGVILANFADEVLDLVPGGNQEVFLHLEELCFHVLGEVDLKLSLACDQQELFVEGGRGRQPDEFQDGVQAAVDLGLETCLGVVYD